MSGEPDAGKIEAEFGCCSFRAMEAVTNATGRFGKSDLSIAMLIERSSTSLRVHGNQPNPEQR